jgi:predicted TIM-barrel fold metal-dependent hydrolase
MKHDSDEFPGSGSAIRNPSESTGPSRRDVLAMMGAAGAGVVLAAGKSVAQSPAAAPRIIDVHHHIYPPEYTKKNVARFVADAPSTTADLFTSWTPHTSLEQMDQNGVATAITSMATPALWIGNNEEARRNARECNEYGAQLGRDFPGRFGMWGALPLPDVDGSLKEIEHVLDVLKLDGVGVLTSYDGGKLLGHKQYAPVMDELNRRKAVIFVHPTVSCCGHPDPMVAGPPIELPVDTTRTIVSLIYSGTIVRCPNLRFIFSHGGGTTLMLYSRLGSNRIATPEDKARIIPNGFIGELRKFYYDIASVPVNPAAMAAIFTALPKDRILFGSDIPFWKIEPIATAANQFNITPGELRGIQRENALTLLPRWRS